MTDLIKIIKTIPLDMTSVTKCLAEMSDSQLARELDVLFAAFDTRNTELCQKLLSRPFDFSVTNANKSTILHIAIDSKMIDVAQNLVEKMSINDLNISNNFGYTALIRAICIKLSNIALRLIDKGVDLNCQSNAGNTALMFALHYDMTDVALRLIEKSTVEMLNVINNLSETALHIAIAKKQINIIKALIDKGVDVHVSTRVIKSQLTMLVETFVN